jgi:hypothetical protein
VFGWTNELHRFRARESFVLDGVKKGDCAW